MPPPSDHLETSDQTHTGRAWKQTAALETIMHEVAMETQLAE
jgi:hypothetical protein